MAKKKEIIEEQPIKENISVEPLEEVMGDRYATYAKYVIQDRAIPDVRDGMKPVQRRIIFSMLKSGNLFNKPTKKCAHTVGAVMGTYHPHGDTSIYEALARMSQDWKMRYPLIDFQGNNGSIDGDSPAAYRYTESRLAELSNELVRDLDKATVDMQPNFDDTEEEPVVLPARFPNLFVNGTEGIAVALATEIPPHNLKEIIEAVIYRINHKNATTADLRQFVLGPDFPGGGIIYRSNGLDAIYETGKGRIEVSSKTEIVNNKDGSQIIITELPYKAVKSATVYEIDKIKHSKVISGIEDVRDESDMNGTRIVIDIKKDAKPDLILKYLLSKTTLETGYSANMVAIVDGRPKTLTLLEYVDAYIKHQVDVVTRKSKFDLDKSEYRLHIVEGLIIASLNIKEVVEIIQASKDKADSKVNLMAKYQLSNDQVEAIVTMPLYKLSHTDELILLKEKEELIALITELKEILEDPNKLNKYLIKDLRAIANKYGDERRTIIVDKEENSKPIDKRDLIAKEDTVVVITRDGYLKRCTIKSLRSSGDSTPGIKQGDIVIATGIVQTTDYIVCFTNKGNYITIPVHIIIENRWKDEGAHINDFTTLGAGEKLVKVFAFTEVRKDLYFALLTKFGQIKRMPMSEIEVSKRSHPSKAMKILANDEIVGVELLSGNSDILVLTSNGNASLYNENELTIVSSKAGGVKSINGLGSNHAAALLAFEESERTKVLLYTDKCHQRFFDAGKINKTARLGKTTNIMQSFKNDVHKVVAAFKVGNAELLKVNLLLSDDSMTQLDVNEFYITDTMNAKKNISTPSKTQIQCAYLNDINIINNKTISHPIIEKVQKSDVSEIDNNTISPIEDKQVQESSEQTKEKKENKSFEQISIFDDIDE